MSRPEKFETRKVLILSSYQDRRERSSSMRLLGFLIPRTVSGPEFLPDVSFVVAQHLKYHRAPLRRREKEQGAGEGGGGYAGRVLICAGDVMAGSEHPVHGGISAARDQDPPTRRLLLPFYFSSPGLFQNHLFFFFRQPMFRQIPQICTTDIVLPLFFFSSFLTSSFLHLVRWRKLRAVDLCLEMKT